MPPRPADDGARRGQQDRVRPLKHACGMGGDWMDFATVDPVAVLDQIRDSQDLFEQALVQMQLVDSFDNRMPPGLSEFCEFFNAHHNHVYAKDQSSESLHRLYQEWLKERRQQG